MSSVITAQVPSQRQPFLLPLSRWGDVGLASVWTLMAAAGVATTLGDATDVGWLTTTHQAVSTMILILSAVLFAVRRPALTKSATWRSRIAAIVGTWMMPLLILLPLTRTAGAVLTLSTIGLIATQIIAFWALFTLRRSFSVFPEARALIRTGPYALVRHPLYAIYFAMYAMFLLPRLSILALVVTALGLACEIWRAHEEEAILGAAFSEYSEYAAATPRFVPRLRVPQQN
jgi:protein-S-isoprenylcysteine O-methyltransferase Ste14